MSLAVLPSIRKKPRLEWRMASETARLAALVASLPWTSTPMPISVIQRTRAIGFPLVQAEAGGNFAKGSITSTPKGTNMPEVARQDCQSVALRRRPDDDVGKS